MYLLGIHGDYFNPERDVFESNAAVIHDGQIVSAISEERLSRTKLDGRFPWLAIEECLRVAGISINDIDEVVFSTTSPKDNALAYLKSTLSTYIDTGILVRNKQKIGSNTKGLLNRLLGSDQKKFHLPNKNDPAFDIRFIDHHYAHAAGAFYGSPFDDALVITLDGGGNGLDGGAYTANNNGINRFLNIPHFQSPGTMYSAITHDLGFRRHRHEGKITGLAAYGKPNATKLGLENLIRYDKSKHRFLAKEIARHHMDLQTNSTYFHPLLENNSREDLSATVQDLFESVICDFVRDAHAEALKKGFKSSKICLAGGCFANVKLNQRILETGLFDNIFVYPAMGDGGLGSGAALHYYYKTNSNSQRNSTLEHVYLGGEFSEKQMEDALIKHGLEYQKSENIEEEIGRLMADGKIVARYNGAMEYGPRALGNRSIIGAPFDPSINDWLNEKLNRTEFMPFAPSITDDRADDYLIGYSEDHKTSDFMTMTYDIKEGMKEKIPAVVHVDNTARPQVVKRSVNESYFKIIKAFEKHTGIPVILNTSFNIHEEPIVYTPEDAIRGFLGARLDILAMGPFLVHYSKNRSSD